MRFSHFCVFFFLLSAWLGAAEIALPVDVMRHIAGEWVAELRSPCGPSQVGTATFSNTSATIAWISDDALTTSIVSGTDEGALTLASLSAYISKDDSQYEYVICEEQVNILPTAERSVLQSRMSTTWLKEYTGVFAASAPSCDSAAERNVVIRVVAMPFESEAAAQWKQKEAIQHMEITFDTELLAGTCKSEKAHVTDKSAPKRRRGAHRNTLAGPSESNDAVVSNGVVVLRFSRKSLPTRSFFDTYKPSLVFMGMFLAYRMVHGFVSYKTSKS